MKQLNIAETFEEISHIQSMSEALDALRALDRDAMILVIGFGIGQPQHGEYWELMRRELLGNGAAGR